MENKFCLDDVTTEICAISLATPWSEVQDTVETGLKQTQGQYV